MINPPLLLSLTSRKLCLRLAIGLAALLSGSASAATKTWSNTSTNATNAGSWTGGLPGAADIGAFTAGTATNNPQLRGNLSLLGLTFGASTAGWTFTGNSGTRTLTIGTSGIVSDSANTQTFSGANLAIALSGAATFTSNSTGGLTFASTLASFNNGGNLLTLAGTSTSANNLIAEVIAGTGGLTKSGSGTWTLSAANTYSGATTVTAGILAYGTNNAINTGTVTVNGGTAILDLGANRTDTVGTVTVAGGGSITGSGTSALTTTGTFEMQSGSVSAILGGAVALNKTTAGTVTLSGANTYTGTTAINDGTLVLNTTAAAAISSTTVTIGDGVGGAASAVLRLAQNNQINDAAAITLGSDGQFDVNGQTETVGSLAGSGKILLAAGQLIGGGNNTSTTFSGTLAGDSSSILTKTGTGILSIDSNLNASPGDFAGTLNLAAGGLTFNASNTFTGTVNVSAGTTLKLSSATVGITNLNFTGSGSITLDFSGTASTLNVTNLSIAAGVTLNIVNWQDAADYFFATNWTGAAQDTTGSSPMNQVIFNAPTWVGNNTKWQSYDNQITPVPEPATYGTLLLGTLGGLLGWRRWRQRSLPAPK